jgi:hypothetical protein
MFLMKREELKELLAVRTGPCVSIYMPTEKGSIETKQNPVRFRKLLKEAEHKLLASGVRTLAAKELLLPTKPMLEDNLFWQYQTGGLAVFLSEKVKRAFTLPLNFTELASVGDRFCVKQLLPLFAEDGRFYVLALSQRSVKLYQCSRHSAAEVDLRQAPKSLADLLELNPREKQLQFHAQTEGHAGGHGQAGMFHGHAEDSDEEKENILTYFHSVNRGVNAVLHNAGGPLVLAGVDFLTRIYEKANTYPQLAEGRICGNPAELRPEELKDRAWEIVRPGFEAAARGAVKQYEQYQDTPRASNHLKTILQAANEGRVGTLLVSASGQRWGVYDDASGVIDIHASPAPYDTELLELCAVRTMDHGGQVHALEPGRMPGKAPAAAVFRY